MPEQPADPIHYDMKIPPEPDPNKQRGPEKPASNEGENATKTAKDSTNTSNTAKDTNVVRGDDKRQAGRGSKKS